MSSTTATYILQTKDGYRVRFGSYLENYEEYKMILDLFATSPFFPADSDSRTTMLKFANEVERANDTEWGIIILNKHKDREFADLRKGEN